MDQIVQALVGVLAAVLAALGAAAVQAVRAYAVNLVQERVGAAAARIAGEIAAEVMGNDQVLAATDEMIRAGAAALAARLPQTAGRLPEATRAGMIAGELGRLGQGVAR